MKGLRSVTVGTKQMEDIRATFQDILGMSIEDKGEAIRIGDAELNPGTRLHFVNVPNYDCKTSHIESIGLRVPTNEALTEYQHILKQHNIKYSEITYLNEHQFFYFHTSEGQRIVLYSDEFNSGTPLGMPSFESSVNPLHQIQGLGPVLLKVNDLMLTRSILNQVFGFEPYAEYTFNESDDHKIQVFRVGDGGLGGEIHIYQSTDDLHLPEYGIVEQIEVAIESKQHFQHAIKQLEAIGIPYQTLDQTDSKSLRINEKSGISFILTLETD